MAARAVQISRHRSRRSRCAAGTGPTLAAEEAQREYTYGAFASLPVLTVTGVPRSLSEPWRPWGRSVSPVRALHELSVLPWRLAVASFLVMLASHGGVGGAARRDAPVAVGADGVVLGAGVQVVVEGCLRRWA